MSTLISTVLRRVRRMTADELRWRSRASARMVTDRVACAFRAPRWDRRAFRQVLSAGVVDNALEAAIAREDWAAAHSLLATRLRSRPAAFPLNPASADSLRVAVLSRWPNAAQDAGARADRILAGSFDLLGYRDLAYGTNGTIDWHFDPVHRRRAPMAFWADVPYLNPDIGDHKIIWELNRHQHFLALGRALWLTEDPRYGAAIGRQLEQWLAANPPLTGINWASMLEIGLRSISWVWALHFLLARGSGLSAFGQSGPEPRAESREPNSPWLVDMLVALDRQARHLESNLSYYFSPNTHLTGEALALYVLGSALPELAGSARWAATGRRILIAEIDRQILPDGGHAERSTHYQRYTLDFYLMALLIARGSHDVDAERRFADAANRLADFTRTIADDMGRLPLIGDDDGGMLWPLAGRACNDVRDSLAIAAALLDRSDLAPWGLQEEALWLAGPNAGDMSGRQGEHAHEGAPRTAGGHGGPPLHVLTSRVLPDTGYVVMRDGTGGHLVFDAGAHGFMNGGHAHADALSITLTTRHRPLLIDPGTATYTMDPALRDRMRGSASHNTLTIDERPSSDPAGPFHWRTRADARLDAFVTDPSFDFAAGSHDGYGAVRHQRRVVRIGDEGWLIVDDVVGEGAHTATAHWHFDPSWMVAEDGRGCLRATHQEGHTAWLLHEGDAVELLLGDEESGAGWCSPAYGTLVPTWTAHITHRAVGDSVASGFSRKSLMTWIDTAHDSERPSVERIESTGVRVTRGSRCFVVWLRQNTAAACTVQFVNDTKSGSHRLRGVTDKEPIWAC